jgi:hypothetical protein
LTSLMRGLLSAMRIDVLKDGGFCILTKTYRILI